MLLFFFQFFDAFILKNFLILLFLIIFFDAFLLKNFFDAFFIVQKKILMFKIRFNISTLLYNKRDLLSKLLGLFLSPSLSDFEFQNPEDQDPVELATFRSY